MERESIIWLPFLFINDMSLKFKLLGLASSAFVFLGCGNSGKVMEPKGQVTKGSSFYSLSVPDLAETDSINMSDFKGKKVLIVNVASKCGYTPQYKDLEALYEANKDKLVIIGMPCNQFMNQESGTNEEIASFCEKNYGVTFPLSTKIDVKGDRQHEIYQWLTKKELNGLGDFSVSWNFNKFLISEDGKLLAHFGSDVKPLGSEIAAYLK